MNTTMLPFFMLLLVLISRANSKLITQNNIQTIQRNAGNVSLGSVVSRQSSQMGVIIVAGSTEFSSSAGTYGKEVHIITSDERDTFNIGDHSLKQSVETYKGRAPNDAFVSSPTPWEDLYSRYNWQQVTTTLIPIHAEILEISSEPVIVKTQTFENDSSQKADFNVAVYDTVSNSVTSTWSTSGSFSISQTLKYNVEFLGTGGGGETSTSFEFGWGVGGSTTQQTTVGSRSGVAVPLDPGEAVVATLRASRGTMKVKVTYRATLSGYVACNYNPRFDDHHFWAFDVNAVMSAGGIPTEKFSSEILDIGYYSDASVILSDLHGN